MKAVMVVVKAIMMVVVMLVMEANLTISLRMTEEEKNVDLALFYYSTFRKHFFFLRLYLSPTY